MNTSIVCRAHFLPLSIVQRSTLNCVVHRIAATICSIENAFLFCKRFAVNGKNFHFAWPKCVSFLRTACEHASSSELFSNVDWLVSFRQTQLCSYKWITKVVVRTKRHDQMMKIDTHLCRHAGRARLCNGREHRSPVIVIVGTRATFENRNQYSKNINLFSRKELKRD